MQKFLLIFLILLFVCLGAGYLILKNYAQPASKNLITGTVDKLTPALPTPSPSPKPFYELTIPYLRSREYKSKLGNLEKVSDNQNYTSYLTSYGSDGLKINGLLTRPKDEKGEKGFPAIVFVHGYIPPKEYQTLEKYNDYIDFLARNGFVVFKIDLRGHGLSEGEASGGYYSSDYIIDTLNAYSALQESGFVDAQKIGLWGHSMSGNIVFRSFAAKQDIPAVVIWAGAVYSYTDFGEYTIADSSYQPLDQNSQAVKKRNTMFETYGGFDPKHPFWKQVPATNYLDGLTGAIQIHHAKDDNVVDIRYSRNLNSILNKTSIAHELHEYPSGGHNFTGNSFNPAMQKTVDFFNKHLR